MSFSAEISRASPTAILFVVDQSTSMRDRLQNEKSKSEFLADVLNKTLYTIITTCSKADGIRDYFHIGVVAYSGKDARNGFLLPPVILRGVAETLAVNFNGVALVAGQIHTYTVVWSEMLAAEE